uniref:Uncharacterized protein n=1 Tax=Hyaloperonospora arabidopsidis (strain Emoy2) TaxID=559515 RepID=M4BN75_HYAAE
MLVLCKHLCQARHQSTIGSSALDIERHKKSNGSSNWRLDADSACGICCTEIPLNISRKRTLLLLMRSLTTI